MDNRRLFVPPPGYVGININFSAEEIRIAARMAQEQETMSKLQEHFGLSDLARSLKDPDADDPFWNRLCDGEITEESFSSELLQHLRISDHPKGQALVRIARKNSPDLQDAYLLALDLAELL